MKAYEGFFIFPPESNPDLRKTEIHQLEEGVKKFGGAVLQKIEAGKRPLGYPVRKFREGYVWIVDFQMDSLKAPEFRKALELQEGLLKYMVVVKKKVKPSKKSAGKTPHASAPAGPQTVTFH